MDCPNCQKYIRPGSKICVYCGFKFTEAGDPRVDRTSASGRGGREPNRMDRYNDAGGSGRGDDYGGRRGAGEPPPPPARGDRTQARGRSRGSNWDEPPPSDTDDSLEAPAYDRRGGDRRDAYGRGGRGYNEDDEDTGGGYEERPAPRAPRPSQRRPPDERPARGSRPSSSRYEDPLDDPRAPGFLRGSQSPRDVGKPGPSSRSSRESRYEDSDEYSGYAEPSGGRRPQGSSRQNWQDDSEYTPAPPRGRSSRDERRGRGLTDEKRTSPSPFDRGPGMPDFPSIEDNAIGWTDPSGQWGAAQSEEYLAARPGPRGPASARNTRRPTGKTAPRASGGQRTKFIALGALLVAVLVGGGVVVAPKLLSKGSAGPTAAPSTFATYTPGPTPTPAANYTLFTSKRSAYILTYPQDWSATEQPASDGDYLDVFNGQGGLPDVNVEQATGFADVSDQGMIDAEVTNAKKVDSTAVYTEDTSAATMSLIGGEQWTRREFDVTSHSVKYRMAILGCHHHGNGYVIVLVSAPADFAKNNSGAFKTMLASFRFVG